MAEYDSVIPAGQSGTLTATIKTNSTFSGQISKSVTVTTDAPGAKRLLLNVRFKAVAAIKVLPRPQSILNGTVGDEASKTVILRRVDGKRLELSKIRTSDQRLRVETERMSENRTVDRQQAVPGDVLVRLIADEEFPATIGNGKVTIATNHPDSPKLELPYVLRIRPLIEPRPTQLRLILQEGNSSSRTALLRIQHNRQSKYKITGTRVTKPDLFRVQLLDGESSQEVHSVAVMLEDSVKPGDLPSRLLETLVLTTDDAKQPEVEVAVLIEPRALSRPGRARPGS